VISKRKREELERLINRSYSAEEFRALLEIPISAEERESTLALIRWFRRRYPTGAERLSYVRKAYKRWVGVSQSTR